MGWVFKVKNFKAEIFFAIKAKKLEEGVLRQNPKLDIKVKNNREGALRQNG